MALYQRRSYNEDVYQTYNKNVQDSAYFELVEIDTSNHELYTPNFNNQGIFPFLQTNEDTSKFFRYIKIDSNDAIKNLYFPDWSNNNTPYLNYAYHLTLLNDTGIVKLVGSKNDNFGWRWDNYDLVEFRYSYPFPYLMIPQKFISLSTLSGTPKDTTIKIVNEGLQTLQITNVVSSDPHFLAVNFTDSIPLVLMAQLLFNLIQILLQQYPRFLQLTAAL